MSHDSEVSSSRWGAKARQKAVDFASHQAYKSVVRAPAMARRTPWRDGVPPQGHYATSPLGGSVADTRLGMLQEGGGRVEGT